MAELEPRRLIKFGNSSFIVSLPKEWIERNNLKKGDWIYLRENEKNEMTLMPKETRHSAETEKKIEIDLTDKEYELFKRELTSAYINNYNLITLKGKNLKQNFSNIKEIIGPLTGLEILEQNPKEVIVKDFLNIETISPKKVLRRLDNIIRAIFEDLESGIDGHSFKKSLFDEIMEEDKNVNKLYLLILKLTKMGLNNQEVMKLFEMTYDELSTTQWLAMNIEHIGDDLKRISRFLTKTNLSNKQKECMQTNMHLIEESFINVMTAYHTKELKGAREVLCRKQTVLKEIEKLCHIGNNVLIGNIAERLRMVNGNICNISKLIIY